MNVFQFDGCSHENILKNVQQFWLNKVKPKYRPQGQCRLYYPNCDYYRNEDTNRPQLGNSFCQRFSYSTDLCRPIREKLTFQIEYAKFYINSILIPVLFTRFHRHISDFVSSKLFTMHGRPPAQLHSNFKRPDDDTVELREKSCKRILVAGFMTLIMLGIGASLVGGILMAVTEASGKDALRMHSGCTPDALRMHSGRTPHALLMIIYSHRNQRFRKHSKSLGSLFK